MDVVGVCTKEGSTVTVGSDAGSRTGSKLRDATAVGSLWSASETSIETIPGPQRSPGNPRKTYILT